MRAIKFRGWDGKRMRQSAHLLIDTSDGALLDLHKDDYREWPIMQFTGKSDKNGKDLYEDDIIREGGRICVIRYSKQYARFEYTTPTGRAGLYGFYGEIIGNIHENPELLDADARGDEDDVADLRDKSWERYSKLIESGKIHYADPRGEPK